MRLPDQLHTRNTEWGKLLTARIEAFDEVAYAAGIQITLQNDFTELKRVGGNLDKLPLTPNFDPDKSDIGPCNGFWMKGVDVTGTVILTQAARLYDCRNTTVALLHETLQAFYRDPAHHAEDGETCQCEAPATHSLTGQVSYHGELWLDRRFRGHNLTHCLSRLLMALVMLRWSPDYLFGMAQPGICRRGVGARYGYRNMQPHGMIWTVPSTGTLDEWVIWNDRKDLKEVISQA